jgi:hypothetical protein
MRLPRVPLSLLLLVCALPLAAEEILVLPPGPTSDVPVVLRVAVFCNPIDKHTVTRTGTLIRVDVTPRPGTCPSPPFRGAVDVALGVLPSGQYTVEVHLYDTVFSKRFVVREAEPALVDVHPFAVPTQPFGSRLRVVAPVGCGSGDCTGVTINVGGVVIPSNLIRVSSDGSMWFDAPPHAAGLVDVTVNANGSVFTAKNALYYFDRSAPPDLSVFERVLFPVLFNSKGAHGSDWVSEAAIANPSRWFIENFNRIDALPCIDYGCSQLLSPASFLPFGGSGYPQGIALLVPRAEASRLAFSLRVRDVARQAEGYGTEVPVVREEDMFTNAVLTLLDVPLDPRYRTKVRVYSFDELASGAFISMRKPETGAVINSVYTPARPRTCNEPSCAATPWYTEVDLPPGDTDERVNLYIGAGEVDSLAWAFASVTNNDTQQVTIVTPDGSGGTPCSPCEVK